MLDGQRRWTNEGWTIWDRVGFRGAYRRRDSLLLTCGRVLAMADGEEFFSSRRAG